MTTADQNPWEPKIAELDGCTEVYRELLKALHACARADASLASMAVIVALADLAADVTVASGALWEKPDIVKALRDLADNLEQRREHGAKRRRAGRVYS